MRSLAFVLLQVAAVVWLGAASAESPTVSARPPALVQEAESAALQAELERLRQAHQRGERASLRPRIAELVAPALALLAGAREVHTSAVCADLGAMAHDLGDLESAERVRRAVLEARERLLPADHRMIQLAAQNLAVTVVARGDLHRARALFERVLACYERTLPAEHEDLLTARMNLGALLVEQGELERARELLDLALEGMESALPADHPELQRVRINLAALLTELGDDAGARSLGEAAVEVYERTLEADHPDLAQARSSLAISCARSGELERARALQEAVLATYARLLPADHPSLALARLQLGDTLESLGEFEGARAMYQEASVGLARALPAGHSLRLSAQRALARTALALGDLSGARALLQRELEATEQVLPADHPDLRRARQDLAAILSRLGDLPAARALEESVLAACERSFPAEHVEVARARMNLAGTLRLSGAVAAARELEEQSLPSFERALSERDPELQRARQNLASSRAMLGDHEGARALFESILASLETYMPRDHPDVQLVRHNLALTLELAGEHGAALELLELVLELHAAGPVPEAPEALLARRHWIELSERVLASDPEHAQAEEVRERCLRLALEVARGAIEESRSALLTGSAREAAERAHAATGSLSQLLSLAHGQPPLGPLPELVEPAFELSEWTRGAALATASIARAALGSAELEELRAELRRASAELAVLLQGGGSREDFHRARARRESAEREIARRVQELAGEDALPPERTASALRAELRERAALVAFRRYERSGTTVIEGDEAGGARRVEGRVVESYCAFVLHAPEPGEAQGPTLVDLGASAPVDRAVAAWRAAIGAAPGAGAGEERPAEGRGLGVEAAVAGRAEVEAHALRTLVWDPLAPLLAEVERVIVVPDDSLHLVPFDALPSGEGDALLGDRWRIELCVAPWELLQRERGPESAGVLVALGGAAFDAAPTRGDAQPEAPKEPRVASRAERPSVLRGGAWESGFAALEHTGPEARAVADLFASRADAPGEALVLEGPRASRLALEELAPRARWLHVATHGWFAPESVRSWSDAESSASPAAELPGASSAEVVRGMSPMLLCGLALAGANLPPDALGRVPGLFSAEELATLDLSSCELAVLSACDTNVGERRAGQGVASLQQALHMAGARSAITSLWKVPDEATAVLMLELYRRLWIDGEPKQRALWEAKRALRAAKDESGRPRYSTRDWAAWVLTGDPD